MAWKKLLGTSLTGGQDYFSEIYRDGSSTVNEANAFYDGGVFGQSTNKLFRGTNIYNLNGASQGDPVIMRMDNNGVIDKYCSINVTGSGVNGNFSQQTSQAILPISDNDVLQCLRFAVSSSSPWYQTLGNAFAIQKVDIENQALDSHVVFWWRDTSFYASVFHFCGAVRVGTDNNFFLFTVQEQSTVWNIVVKISDSGSVTWEYAFRTGGSPTIVQAGGIDTDGTYLYISHAGEGASPQGAYLSVFDGSGSSLSHVYSAVSFNNTRNQANTLAVDAANSVAYVVDSGGNGNVTQYDISTPSSLSVNWRRKLQYNQYATSFYGRSVIPDGNGDVVLISRYLWGTYNYTGNVIWGLDGAAGTNNFVNGYKTTSGYTFGKGNEMPYQSNIRSGSLKVLDGTMYLPYFVRQTGSSGSYNSEGSLVVPVDGSLTSSSALSVGGSHYYNTFSDYTPTNTSQTIQSISSGSLQIYTASSVATKFNKSTTNTTATFIGQSSLGSITQTRAAIT